MAKHNWNITRQKRGMELYVSNAYKEIFIGEMDDLVSEERQEDNYKIARIVCDSLNENNPFKPEEKE